MCIHTCIRLLRLTLLVCRCSDKLSIQWVSCCYGDGHNSIIGRSGDGLKIGWCFDLAIENIFVYYLVTVNRLYEDRFTNEKMYKNWQNINTKLFTSFLNTIYSIHHNFSEIIEPYFTFRKSLFYAFSGIMVLIQQKFQSCVQYDRLLETLDLLRQQNHRSGRSNQ